MKKDIIDRIKDKLDYFEGDSIYVCELGYSLFEKENVDNTFTYDRQEAKEWIKSNFDDIGEVWEELNFQLGGDYMQKFNLFDDPEQFMVVIIIEATNYLLGRCKYIEDRWNDKIKLSKRSINIIKKQLNEFDDDGSIYE